MLVSQADPAFWSKEVFTDETLSQWQGLAKVSIAAYAGRTELVEDGDTLINGVTALNLSGHTPGQMVFRADDGTHRFIN